MGSECSVCQSKNQADPTEKIYDEESNAIEYRKINESNKNVSE